LIDVRVGEVGELTIGRVSSNLPSIRWYKLAGIKKCLELDFAVVPSRAGKPVAGKLISKMETRQSEPFNLPRTLLAVLAMGVLIVACFQLIRPFLSSLLWSVMIVIATWPMMIKLQARLWGKRWLATAAMTAVLLLVLIVPVCFAVLTILDHTDDITGWAKSAAAVKIPEPPAWLPKLPGVGQTATNHWEKFAATSPQELSKMLAPYATKVVGWFVGQAGNFGMLVLHFLLSIVIAAVLYLHGEGAAAGVLAFMRRLAGEQGESVAVLAAKSIRGVALGIVVTALVQSVLGGLGLLCAGVPAAMLLTAVMLILCITQIGPGLVLVPAAIWLFWSGHHVTGVIFSVWTIFCCTVDSFLRPVLIRKGADLPLLLILTGVLGGLISFGIIGLFIGPLILAVSYTLLRAWVAGRA
jgi:predicted PurR-regulated permease PerM